MSLLEQFELPLPIVKCSAEKITVEIQGQFEGVFSIQNTGGGELSGSITSNSKMISFSPENFTGNKTDIHYMVDISNYKIGDVIQTSALIMSNGGELIVPIILKITPPAIITKEKEQISSLKEFLWYAKTFPIPSRQLFNQKEFMMWLLSMNYEHMELYEHFVSDPNKERAVDNFLIFNRLKKKSVLSVLQSDITIDIPSYSKEITTGIIPLKLTGWGYIEAALYPGSGASWLTITKSKINSHDFDEDGNCSIDFFVNPAKLFHKRESVIIKIVPENGDAISITLTAAVRPPYSAKLSKNSYSYEDTGYVILENYKGGEMTIDLQSDSPHIKFEGRQYFIKDRAQIPFNIKVGAFTSAQSFISKQSVINAKIYVSVDRRLFVLGMSAKLLTELPLVIAKPIE